MSVLFLRGLKIALDALMQKAAAPSGTIKVDYMDHAYMPNSATQQYWADISSLKAAGAPTEVLTNVTVNIDAANFRVEVDADDITESGVTTTTDKFVIWLDTGNPATSPLIYCGGIGATLTPVAGTIGLTFNSEGIFAINDN